MCMAQCINIAVAAGIALYTYMIPSHVQLSAAGIALYTYMIPSHVQLLAAIRFKLIPITVFLDPKQEDHLCMVFLFGVLH